MAYAILRFAKHKGGASKALSAHHERTKEFYASNPDIDKSRTVQNYHLIAPRWSYAGDPTPYQHGGLPGAQGQREICGDFDHNQPGVCKST